MWNFYKQDKIISVRDTAKTHQHITNSVQHHAVPDFFGEGELPVELQLYGMIGTHLHMTQ